VTVRSRHLGSFFPLPDAFPVVPYDSIVTWAHRYAQGQQETYRVFVQAFHGVAYRFVSAFQSEDRFRALIVEHGNGPGPIERQLQEHELFGFFTNALSSLECAAYGLYAVGALLAPATFKLLETEESRQWVSPKTTLSEYRKAFPDEMILTGALARMDAKTGDPRFTEIARMRNILAHRVVMGRHFLLSTGALQGPDAFLDGVGLPLSSDMLAPFMDDLARLLGDLLDAGAAFLHSRQAG
jgi:hypothetical protein